MGYKSERDKMLIFLKPIWQAKKWDFRKLEKKPDYQLKAIYLKYYSNTELVNKILNEYKRQNNEEQLCFFIENTSLLEEVI